MKKIAVIGGSGLLLVVIILSLLISNIDSIVKAAIEKIGSDVTQVAVTVDEVKIKLTEGKGTIRGLKVSTPKSFDSPHTFSLGEIHLAIDPSSITEETVVINEIRVSEPSVWYEFRDGDSNVATIHKSVDHYSGDRSRREKDEKSNKKLIVKRLSILKTELSGKAELLGQSRDLKLHLPDIRLKGIGQRSGGVEPAKLASMVIKHLSSAATVAVRDQLGLNPKAITGKVKAEAQKLLKGGKSNLQNLLKKNIKSPF